MKLRHKIWISLAVFAVATVLMIAPVGLAIAKKLDISPEMAQRYFREFGKRTV